MKINCPHCHCAYDLEPVKMPAPKYNAMQESWGWKFECGACDHQWWLKLINAEGLSASQREVADDVNMELRFFDNRYRTTHGENKKSSDGCTKTWC